MDADSTEDAPSPSHLSSSSPGYYSVPIRAPLTIDSDSEFVLSVNDQIHSRTNSFNSSSSGSIDVSSYGDEHTSIFEEYPDEEIVIERSHVEESLNIRPFVRYPDANYVQESCSFSESAVFRPFVKIPFEESGSANYVKESCNFSESTVFRPFVRISFEESGSAGVGVISSVPIAPLTHDGDSDTDSGGGSRWDDSGWISNNGIAQKVAFAPKVRSFNGDEEDYELETESVISGNDVMKFVSSESIENNGCEVERLNEVVKLSDSDASGFDLERISSNDAIETKLFESYELRFDSERIDAQIVSNSDSEIGNLSSFSTESIATEGCKVECLNEAVKLCDLDASGFDMERIDAQTRSSSKNEIETELSKSDDLSFGSGRIDAQIVSNSDSGIENLSYVSTKSTKKEGCKVVCLNEALKLSESDVTCFDLEGIDSLTVSSSNNETEIEQNNEKLLDGEIEIKTINEVEQEVVSKTEEETQKKMQRVRAKFLRLALNEQLTTEVNGEGGNYKFDFSLTILAIGKTGVGKSATINSIFGENKAITNAFDPGTTTIQEITGNVDGIQLRVIDTPGLKRSYSDRSYNLRILNSVKRFTRKHSPNVVLYVDRLDAQDVSDSHLLTLITSSLGSSVWHNCIVALTHAGRDPSGEPSNGFVVRRCRFLQEQIVGFGGNNRPVWLVDNHPSCRHDVMDLDFGLKGLVCLDQADEDDGCDKVYPSEPLSEPRNVIDRSRERRDTYFMEYGYRVKLVGCNHWSLGCRFCF